jgi:hypothetical protein
MHRVNNIINTYPNIKSFSKGLSELKKEVE